MLKRRDSDGDEGATTRIESERRSIDEGWASLTNGSDPGADHGSGRADGSEPSGDELQAAYDAATRRAADWYSSRLGPRDDRTGRTAGVDR